MAAVRVIGIGAGDPAHLTLAAVEALGRTDVFFVPDKGDDKGDLKGARLDAIARFAKPGHRVVEIAMPTRERLPSDYGATVAAWHGRIADAYAVAFASLAAHESGALLVWGDPSLYDSTLRILETMQARGSDLTIEVVPGISAIQALCARHRIPLNGIGEPVLLTTGRRLAADWSGAAGTVVVLLDGEEAFARLDGADAIEIAWGAYLGTADELLIAGRLDEVSKTIVTMRRAARARKGWIMDTYLLRRSPA